MKRMLTILLAFLMVISMGTVAFGQVQTNASNWAKSAMEKAYEAGFITEEHLQNAQGAITRQEFCEIVVLFCEQSLGRTLSPMGESPFGDTDNASVIIAYELGIVAGVEEGVFAPDNQLTREAMAIMLVRALEACDVNLLKTAKNNPFTDTGILYTASKKAVNKLYGAGIISGDVGAVFAPLRELKVQEAISAFVRAYEYYQKQSEMPSDAEATTESVVDTTDTQSENVAGVNYKTVTIGGKKVSLGQTIEEVRATWGTETRVDNTVYGYSRYVYVNDYEAYFFVTIKDNVVVEIFTPSKQFDYLGTTGAGTSVDIKYLAYISASDHSGVVRSDETEARIPLNYEGEISGLWLQDKTFAYADNIKSAMPMTLRLMAQQEIIDFIQVKRKEAGAPLLNANERLHAISLAHTTDMIDNGYVAYNSQDGTTPFARILNAGIYFTTASELVIKQRGDVVNVYQEIIRTAAQYGSIVDSTVDTMGIGIGQKNKELYVTMDFCGGFVG